MPYGIDWSREGESFPIGSCVRVSANSTPTEGAHIWAGAIGRVTHTAGRIVTVRFPGRSPFGGPEVASFDADWLHRVAYAESRYYGPGMRPGAGEFSGTAYVVHGRRGNRQQYTHLADLALSPLDNHMTAVRKFATERLGMCRPEVETIRERGTRMLHVITDTGTCECSDEYGPCEFHGETVVMREGSASRAADDLAHTFLGDVASVLRRWPSEEFRKAELRLGNALHDSGGSWFDDPDDADECRELCTEGESALGDAGYVTYWDDGYRIIRPLPGCPMLHV